MEAQAKQESITTRLEQVMGRLNEHVAMCERANGTYPAEPKESVDEPSGSLDMIENIISQIEGSQRTLTQHLNQINARLAE